MCRQYERWSLSSLYPEITSSSTESVIVLLFKNIQPISNIYRRAIEVKAIYDDVDRLIDIDAGFHGCRAAAGSCMYALYKQDV
jgi:hypothetical protein